MKLKKLKKFIKALRAFTLIELMVVIGIVGVLAAIVLIAVSGSRSSASDATVKDTLTSAYYQLSLDGRNTGDYGVPYPYYLCPTASNPPDPIFYTDTQLRTYIANLNAANGTQTTCAAGVPGGASNATSWAIASPIKSSTTQWWCVDSKGNSKLSSTQDTHIRVFEHLLTYVTPTAHADVGFGPPPGPNLGGGANTAACP
jgi:prepilin-type N-terminal cleavage/methylation domain-containing protein